MPSSRHIAKRLAHHAKNHFIPHAGNGYHPHALKHHALIVYSVLLILLKVVALTGSIVLPSSSLSASAITSANIIALTNATRQSLGLSTLELDERLAQAAQAKADDMARNGYFAHTSPAGVTPWYWIKKFGYVYRYSGENLAIHFSEAEDVQSGWMASPGHRANIVSSRYRHIGVGIASGQFEGFPTTFVVQMFALPKMASAVVQAPVPAASTSVAVVVPAALEPTLPSSDDQELAQVKAAIAASPEEDEIPVAVVPVAGQYLVKVSSASTTKAVVHLAGKSVELRQATTTPDIWMGSVPLPTGTVMYGGESLYVTRELADGSRTTRAAVLVVPEAHISHLFGFQAHAPREIKLFGVFTLENLQDSVRRVYIFFIIFLAAALLVNVAVKIRIQKLSVIAHGLMVLSLGVVLYLL